MIRQPIITVLGHVDHGKTTLLDYIRGTTLAQREAGKITQHIGATEVPLETLKKVCGPFLKAFKMKFTIPGLLFIDTPGHEAFTNLRKRGGSIADIAILIIDINQGVQPQTKEAIDILKTFKVPFVIAATKIDVLPGWKSHDSTFIVNLTKQLWSAKEVYEKKFYNLLGQVSELGFSVNLYKEVKDYSKEVAVVPISAKTGEGIAELLALLTGLAQKFLSKKLEINEREPAKGTILEIKEDIGMGTTADVVVYSGSLKQNDLIVVGGINDVFTTRIKSLLKPLPLSEIRDRKSRFKRIELVTAASGVKILAPNLNKAIAGAPFASARSESEVKEARRAILNEIEEVLIHTEQEGIILKADTLGSLEAATNLLEQRDIPIKKADIGDITKKDIIEAASNIDTKPELAFVLGFNVKASSGIKKYASEKRVVLIIDQVIYKIFETYEKSVEALKAKLEMESIAGLIWPAKIKILPQYIFRQSNPAIFGVEVIAGKLKPNTELITTNGRRAGLIKTIEDHGEKIRELESGKQAAISVQGLTIGRQASGGDILYVDLDEDTFRTLKSKIKKVLSKSEVQVLKEIAEIKRKEKDLWGL